MYVEMVIAQDAYAKEVKLFGLGPRFLRRYRQIFEKLYAGDRHIAINRGVWALILGTSIDLDACITFVSALESRG